GRSWAPDQRTHGRGSADGHVGAATARFAFGGPITKPSVPICSPAPERIVVLACAGMSIASADFYHVRAERRYMHRRGPVHLTGPVAAYLTSRVDVTITD